MERYPSGYKGTVCFDDSNTLKKDMNVNTKGNLTELLVMTAAVQEGCVVSIPYGNCDKYDQIWDINGKMLRVQVKTSRPKNKEETAIMFNCYSVSNGKKHKYSKEEIDYFATFWNNQCYLVPVEQCSTEKTLWFELTCSNPKCALAKNFLLTEVLKSI